MSCSITVTLPPEVKNALDNVAKQTGTQAEVVAGQAIKEHLFLRQFRLLRERMAAHAQGLGILSDQDVFDRVS